MGQEQITLDDMLTILRAAAEPTRARLLALFAVCELTVKDATAILAQSQPRLSRHLKLLSEAGIIDRHPEGAWVYYRLSDKTPGAVARSFLALLNPRDANLVADRARLDALRKAKAAQAEAYFKAHAASWDAERSLHVPQAAVEAAMRAAIGPQRIDQLLDLGTGTGRMLEIFADLYTAGLGIDQSQEMLAVARANLAAAGIVHAQVRHGDIYALNAPGDSFDVVIVHQVLHYLEEPQRAVREAARLLRPGGRLLIVDFAPHDEEFLRAEHAHRRLGFAHEQVNAWLQAAGLGCAPPQDLAASDSPSRLTVTLWLAQDPRCIADPLPAAPSREFA